MDKLNLDGVLPESVGNGKLHFEELIPDDLQTVIVFAVVALLIIVFIKLLKTPLKFIVKFIFNTLLGFGILMLINHFGAMVGITVAVNWLNAVIIGILGLPGLALLLILKLIL